MSWSPLYCYSIKTEEAFYKNENVGQKANLAFFIFAEFGHFGSKYGSNGRRSRVSTYHDNLDWKIFISDKIEFCSTFQTLFNFVNYNLKKSSLYQNKNSLFSPNCEFFKSKL